MKSKVIIKSKLIEDGEQVNIVKTNGNISLIINGVLDLLHTICEDAGIDKKEVIKVFKDFDKQIISKGDK